MNEVWKDVDGYEGLYEVSNFGRVRSLNYNRTGQTCVMSPGKDGYGYLCVVLSKAGKLKRAKVHRLVGKAFVPGWFEGAVINHKDHNHLNNVATNLEWTTQADNCSPEKSFCAEISKKLKSKRLLQFTNDGQLVREWPSTWEVQRQLGFNHGNIGHCCRGKRKSAYGFRWQYVN